MKAIPRYPKVLTLGSSMTENALEGTVFLQEKVDGSQFRFGVNDDGKLLLGTRNTQLSRENPDKMFRPVVSYLLSIESRITENFKPDTYFYAEYLAREKHNVLRYDRIPKNYLVLFDCLENGGWVERDELEEMAKVLDIDVIPEFLVGKATVDTIKDFLKNDSFLGREKVEGVVIKNYHQHILLGGMVFPLFTKYVREEYRERHNKEWKVQGGKQSLMEYIQSFQNENRWEKAVQHLRDAGKLTQSPKDIGALIKEIQSDILEEEAENIKNYLFSQFKKDILRYSIKGFPEWYKDKLLENLKK